MGETPTTTNPTVAFADTVLHGVFYDLVLQAAIKYAQVQVPFLSLPIIGTLFGWAVNWFGGIIYTQMERYVSFTIIDLQVGHENSAYKDAVTEFKEAVSKGDEDAKRVAKEELKKRLGNLIHYGGD